MITIRKPGLLTSVQNLGRWGLQRYGISPGGAADPVSHRLANLLVGNEEDAPALEMTLLGAEIEFHQDALIAICGADMSAKVGGATLPAYRPVCIPQGTVVTFGSARSGCRTYLACAGGFQESDPGDRTERTRAMVHGETLSIGQPGKRSLSMLRTLQERPKSPYAAADWYIRPLTPSNKEIHLRITKGRAFGQLTRSSQQRLLEEPFSVLPQSNRMGCRLQGPQLLFEFSSEPLTGSATAVLQMRNEASGSDQTSESTRDEISEPVSTGTIQLPPGGQPIVLLPDRQTTGGYPRIGHVISADLPLLGQAAPGCSIRFSIVAIEQAQQLYREQERRIERLARWISLKYDQL